MEFRLLIWVSKIRYRRSFRDILQIPKPMHKQRTSQDLAAGWSWSVGCTIYILRNLFENQAVHLIRSLPHDRSATIHFWKYSNEKIRSEHNGAFPRFNVLWSFFLSFRSNWRHPNWNRMLTNKLNRVSRSEMNHFKIATFKWWLSWCSCSVEMVNDTWMNKQSNEMKLTHISKICV